MNAARYLWLFLFLSGCYLVHAYAVCVERIPEQDGKGPTIICVDRLVTVRKELRKKLPRL